MIQPQTAAPLFDRVRAVSEWEKVVGKASEKGFRESSEQPFSFRGEFGGELLNLFGRKRKSLHEV